MGTEIKIKKIFKINDFGIFKNFDDSSLSDAEFKEFNLIYGWNYSGKTTLSRVFRCFEKKERHKDYEKATFEIGSTEKKYNDNFYDKLNITVFNTDFIKENLKWESEESDKGIEPIFILGEKNIELQNQLEEEQKKLEEENGKLRELEKKKSDKKDEIEDKLTKKARDIKSDLKLSTFDKSHLKKQLEELKDSINKHNLKKQLEELKDSINKHILTEEEAKTYREKAISEIKETQIHEINYSINDLEQVKNNVSAMLKRKVVSSNTIKRLVDDASLNQWVEEGKKLHEGKSRCQFCESPLPSDLFERLNKHFSKEYDNLQSEIESLLKKLDTYCIKESNRKLLLPDVRVYKDKSEEFKSKKSCLEKQINNFNNVIDLLKEDIKKKKSKLLDTFEVTVFSYSKNDFDTALNNCNAIIKDHNERTAKFDEQKKKAGEKIQKHYVAKFAEEYGYFGNNGINCYDEYIKKSKDEIKKLEDEIKKIQEQIKNIYKGAEAVNTYLEDFFGKNDIGERHISIKVNEEGTNFELLRGTERAKNLSEGEKTAIAFAYFLAKLKENNNMKNKIVYIDDPISSLDANHLFNVYALIKDIFFEQRKKYEELKCEQLFISTHNFEFYNLINKLGNKHIRQFFIIQRMGEKATIIKGDNLISKYKTEYVYLFSLIYAYSKKSTDTTHLYCLPNILRRFIETYLNFRWLLKGNITEADIDKLIDKSSSPSVWRFINSHSHTTSKTSEGHPDLSSLEQVVKSVIKGLEKNDSEHFKALQEAVKEVL